MRDGGCSFSEQVSKGDERAGSAVSAERLLATMLHKLLTEKELASFVSCVRERTCLDEACVMNGNDRMTFVRSRLIHQGLCPS